MPFGLIIFSQRVSLSFCGNNMKQFGSRNIFQILKRIHQLIEIVSVDGSKISQFQCLKQIAALADKTFNAMFYLAGDLTAEMTAHRKFTQCFPDIVLEFIISLGSSDIG